MKASTDSEVPRVRCSIPGLHVHYDYLVALDYHVAQQSF